MKCESGDEAANPQLPTAVPVFGVLYLSTDEGQLPIFVDCSLYMFNILRCSACWRPSRTWITFNRFLTMFEAFVLHFYCATLIASSPKVFWILQIFSAEECSSLMQNLMQTHCFTQSFWMRWPHSTHAHSIASTAPTDQYSEVIIVHTCVFQSTLLGFQVTFCSCYINYHQKQPPPKPICPCLLFSPFIAHCPSLGKP